MMILIMMIITNAKISNKYYGFQHLQYFLLFKIEKRTYASVT